MVEKRRFKPTPSLFGAPVGGDLVLNFADIFGVRKLESLGYRMALLMSS